jgi:hypothetical protein
MDLYKITEKLESKGWDLNNDFLSNNEDFLQALIDETERAISVTRSCKSDRELLRSSCDCCNGNNQIKSDGIANVTDIG